MSVFSSTAVLVEPSEQLVDLGSGKQSSRIAGVEWVDHLAERRVQIPRDIQDLELVPIANVCDF